MNERIKELYKRAMVTVPANPGNKEFTWFDPEKFAELIVRQCATIADFAHLGGVIEPGVMVKEYFGVEE